MKEQEEMESGAVVSQGPVMWGLSGEGFAFYSEQEEAMEDSWARRWQDTLCILGKKKKKKSFWLFCGGWDQGGYCVVRMRMKVALTGDVAGFRYVESRF